VIINCLK